MSVKNTFKKFNILQMSVLLLKSIYNAYTTTEVCQSFLSNIYIQGWVPTDFSAENSLQQLIN